MMGPGFFMFFEEADVAAIEGIEFTLPANKMHYTLDDEKLHYTFDDSQLHYTLQDDEPC